MSKDSSSHGPKTSAVASADDKPSAGDPAPRSFWSPLSAILIGVLTFVGSLMLASVPFAVYPLLQHWTAEQTDTWINGAYIQFAYVLLAESLTIGSIWWFTRRGGLRMQDIGWRRFRLSAIVYALCGFAVYFAAFIVLTLVSSALVPQINLNQQQDIGFQQVQGAGQLTVTFLSLVVLPPIAEELFFRGFLFTSFRRRMGMWVSILLTSALFAVPHLLESKQPGSPLWVAGMDTFTLSIVLCYLREKTNSLWPGIVLHALKNSIAFASLFIFHIS